MNLEHDNLSGGRESLTRLAADIKSWGRALGFDEVGIGYRALRRRGGSGCLAGGRLPWADGLYVQTRGQAFQARGPGAGYPAGDFGACRICRMPRMRWRCWMTLPGLRVVLYALGRDYHKVLRARLQRLADRSPRPRPMPRVSSIRRRSWRWPSPRRRAWAGGQAHPAAVPAGGVVLLSGEIYTDLLLPVDAAPTPTAEVAAPASPACLTGAIVAPYRVDARRCISYLTIELKERSRRCSAR